MNNKTLDNLSVICQKKRIQLAIAESCTGGLVAKIITDRAGSSSWFERGFVTYSNLAKNQMLGVEMGLIEQWGAVSEPVARAMSEGALKHSAAHYALSITGIAGPDGGTQEKPVGTVCFGWSWYAEQDGSVKVMITTRHFSGDRAMVRNQSAQFALQQLYQLILTEGQK